MKSSDDYIGDANQTIGQGYSQAAAYESPYTSYSSSDFGTARNYLYKSLGNRQNYNETFLKYLNMSPTEMLHEVTSSYSVSPFAQEEEKVGLDASNNAMTAAGMGGSEDNALADAEIGNTIVNQDESRYMNQIMQALGIQSDVLSGYDKETTNLMKFFQDMLGTEEGASTNMANNAIKSADSAARADESGAREATAGQRNKAHEGDKALHDAFSVAGMALLL